MLFRPLAQMLKRSGTILTKGARKRAEESLASAERKTAEYEAKLREARGEVYREQEEMRRNWLSSSRASRSSASGVNAPPPPCATRSFQRSHGEAAAARTSLLETSGMLADQIVGSILNRRAR